MTPLPDPKILQTEIEAALREHAQHHAGILTRAKAYLAQIEAEAEAGLVVIREHRWLVVVDGGPDAPEDTLLLVVNATDGVLAALVPAGIPGDLLGVSRWGKEAAEQIAEHWRANAPEAIRAVTVMQDDALVRKVAKRSESELSWCRNRAARFGIELGELGV